MKLTKEQIENVKSFLLETFAFNEEQLAAIDGLIGSVKSFSQIGLQTLW